MKQHRRDLLSSLLFQLSARSDACPDNFSRFYLDHDEGAHRPPDDALSNCLTDMLKVQGQPATYIIIDAQRPLDDRTTFGDRIFTSLGAATSPSGPNDPADMTPPFESLTGCLTACGKPV